MNAIICTNASAESPYLIEEQSITWQGVTRSLAKSNDLQPHVIFVGKAAVAQMRIRWPCGNSRSTISGLPSVEALSTTTDQKGRSAIGR